MKKYSDGEFAPGKVCKVCKTTEGVFYDRKSDFFLCCKCEYEMYKKEDRRSLSSLHIAVVNIFIK